MRCPVCAGKLRTVLTRADCEQIYRRKKCLACGYIVWTVETENENEAREAFKRLWRGNEE